MEAQLRVFKAMRSTNQQYKWRTKRIHFMEFRTIFRSIHTNNYNYFESFASFQVHEQNYNRCSNGKK